MCGAQAHVCFGPKADMKGLGKVSSDECRSARQNNFDLSELAGLRVDFDQASVLFDDDVMADREAKAGAFSGRLSGEEWVKYLVFYFRRNTSAVISDRDFHSITEVLGRGRKRRLVVTPARFTSALGCGIEAI